jgi:hypothetical protein
LFRKAEPIGPPSFLAEVVHLLAFTSDRWKGWWWETLRWKLLAVLMNPRWQPARSSPDQSMTAPRYASRSRPSRLC